MHSQQEPGENHCCLQLCSGRVTLESRLGRVDGASWWFARRSS